MMRLLVSLVLLTFDVAAAAAEQPVVLIQLRRPHQKALLAVRGGAGPIDPEVAAKVLTGAFLVQGTSMALAPKAAAKAYGRECTPLSEICSASCGAYVAALGVVPYALLVNKSTVHGAIGAGIVTIAIGDFGKSLLTDFSGRHGMNPVGLILSTCFLASTAFANLANLEHRDLLTKALCAYGAFNGVFGCVSPVRFATSWGLKKDEVESIEYQHVLRLYSWSLMAFCVMTWTLLEDVATLNSLAYAALVMLAGFLSQNYITQDTTKLEMKVVPQHACMVGLAIVASSILL